MGLFSRRNPFDDDGVQEHVDRAKRTYAQQRQIREAHQLCGNSSPATSGKSGSTRYPASPDASTHRTRRRR